MKHLISVVVLIVVVTVILLALLNSINLLPPQASAEAVPIDWLFGLHLQVIAFLFALIMVFMIYSVVVFRRKPGDTEDGDYFHGNTALEIIWTIVPLAIVLYFGYLGTITLIDITAPVEDELVVEVVSSQWSWRFDYPDQGISSTVLNLPQGRTALLQLTSTDVLHDFWVPEFRVKQDAVPGMVKELRITPTQLGAYKVRCAELCGLSHAYMLAEVNVMAPAEFDGWVAQEGQQAAATPAERGAQVAQLQGCQGCHSVDGGVVVGPSWLGIFGSEETLADGTTVTVDEDYIRNSILHPNDQIVNGFQPNIMPATYEDLLTPEEIDDLIEYIKSLGE